MSSLSQQQPPPRADAPDHLAQATQHPGRAWSRDARRRRLLAGADALTIVAASLGFGTTSGSGSQLGLFLLAAVMAAVLTSKLLGRFDRDHRVLCHSTADELPATLAWSAVATLTLLLLMGWTGQTLPSTGSLAGVAIAIAVVNMALRAAARQLWRQTTPPERIAIVGSGPLERVAQRKFDVFSDLHVDLVASFPEDEAFGVNFPRTGRLERLGHDIDRILVASTTIDERLLGELVKHCRTNEIKLGLVPPARGMFGTAVVLDHLAELPIVQYNTWNVSRSTMLGKRVVDVVGSALALVVVLPALPVIALAIRLDSPGPVLFRQTRAGQGGRPFRMLKFRTMCVDAESRLGGLVDIAELKEPVFKLRDDVRVTRVGRWLRRTSLDELPQLYNVLRGQMSLVGPRPEQLDLVDRYTADAREIRLAVKPGITGPMQVFGRGALTFDERLSVERDYVENLSLARDMRILARTASAVVRARGAF